MEDINLDDPKYDFNVTYNLTKNFTTKRNNITIDKFNDTKKKIEKIKKLIYKEVLVEITPEEIEKKYGWKSVFYYPYYNILGDSWSNYLMEKVNNPYNLTYINNTLYQRRNISYYEGFDEEPPDVIKTSTEIATRSFLSDYLDNLKENWQYYLSKFLYYIKNYKDQSSNYVYATASAALFFGGLGFGTTQAALDLLKYFNYINHGSELAFDIFNSGFNFENFQSHTIRLLLGDLILHGRFSDYIFNQLNVIPQISSNLIRQFIRFDGRIMDEIIRIPSPLNYFDNFIENQIVRPTFDNRIQNFLNGDVHLNIENVNRFIFNEIYPRIRPHLGNAVWDLVLGRNNQNRVMSRNSRRMFNILNRIYLNYNQRDLRSFIMDELIIHPDIRGILQDSINRLIGTRITMTRSNVGTYLLYFINNNNVIQQIIEIRNGPSAFINAIWHR